MHADDIVENDANHEQTMGKLVSFALILDKIVTLANLNIPALLRKWIPLAVAIILLAPPT
jgi:hypothetical protein